MKLSRNSNEASEYKSHYQDVLQPINMNGVHMYKTHKIRSIIIGIIAGAIGGSVGVYKTVVVPKKREKSRILNEVKTIFDDAINIEYILVLYKGTGMCIFFKAINPKKIKIDLISGFLSAVNTFGKEMESQETLNEITYGDKMLLLSDGEFIRVALVLNKKASIILRKHLKEFYL